MGIICQATGTYRNQRQKLISNKWLHWMCNGAQKASDLRFKSQYKQEFLSWNINGKQACLWKTEFQNKLHQVLSVIFLLTDKYEDSKLKSDSIWVYLHWDNCSHFLSCRYIKKTMSSYSNVNFGLDSAMIVCFHGKEEIKGSSSSPVRDFSLSLLV